MRFENIIPENLPDKIRNAKPMYFHMNYQKVGMIQCYQENGIVWIGSKMYNNYGDKFTYKMLKYLIELSKTNRICLISEISIYHDRIIKALDRYGCEYHFVNDNLYAVGGKNV